MNDFRVFVQARTSSRRFPGKVLAPLHGRPIINHVICRLAQAVPKESIIIATSVDVSDDSLASFLRDMRITVFRGPLEDVFTRFQMCLWEFPCDWFFRVCADSPLLDSKLIPQMLALRTNEPDLVTNVQWRTFPRGQSLELLNARTFASIDAAMLSADEREHLTKVFYAHPDGYRIVNLVSPDPNRAEQSLAIDTPDDLRRLEQMPLPEFCV